MNWLWAWQAALLQLMTSCTGIGFASTEGAFASGKVLLLATWRDSNGKCCCFAGAAPYLTEAQRFSMGVVRPAAAGEAADHTHALRFTAYEKAAAPSPAAPAPLTAIPAGAGTSPVRERPAAGTHGPLSALPVKLLSSSTQCQAMCSDGVGPQAPALSLSASLSEAVWILKDPSQCNDRTRHLHEVPSKTENVCSERGASIPSAMSAPMICT